MITRAFYSSYSSWLETSYAYKPWHLHGVDQINSRIMQAGYVSCLHYGIHLQQSINVWTMIEHINKNPVRSSAL